MSKKLTEFLEINRPPRLPVQVKIEKPLHEKTKAFLKKHSITWQDLLEASVKRYVAECEEGELK